MEILRPALYAPNHTKAFPTLFRGANQKCCHGKDKTSQNTGTRQKESSIADRPLRRADPPQEGQRWRREIAGNYPAAITSRPLA